MKTIAILGSTGSIGQQTLDVIRQFPRNFKVLGLAAGNNTKLLESQIDEFKPKLVHSPHKLHRHFIKLTSMEEIASHPEIDLIVVATSGKIALMPTIAAIRAGKKIGLSNKEILVMAGHIITSEAKKYNAQILPIDSEHSAIWQCLRNERNSVSKIILTASGGPFYTLSAKALACVTPAQALKHPTWKMGQKVTIDSATLMNKGLEIIEAHWLFSMPFDRIDVIIHTKSIVHSLVEFADGSIKAQLSHPDMHLPIQYALSYPKRLSNTRYQRMDLTKVAQLRFEPAPFKKFPCLSLAIEAGKKGGTYPAVLCAADEVAVELFLTGRIRFTDIAPVIEKTLAAHTSTIDNPNLDEILASDSWARDITMNDHKIRK